MIRLVLVLLAVTLAVSCDVNQPHEEIEQEPEPPEMVSVLIQASEVIDGDSVRVTNASIEFNGGGYNNKVVATNGIFDEMLEARDVDIDVYAYAEGFKTVDTLTINLNNNVNEIIILQREDEEPDPEGPGKLEFTAQSCADDGSVDNGTVTVNAENGFTEIKLINVKNNEVVKDITGLSPEEDQTYTFSDVPNGEYRATAMLNEKESTTAETVVIDCEIPEGPGKVKITNTTCTDPDTNNGSLTGTVENGAEMLTLKRGESAIDEKEDVQPGEEFAFSGLPVGNYEVVANKNDVIASAFGTITECDQPEPPTARFSVETDGLTAFYDGSESTTPNERIVEWAWDFDNNDKIDATSEEPTIEHVFDTEGSKTSRLRVTDDLGLTHQATVNFTVEKPNTAPEVKFTVKDKDYLTVTFRNQSSDPDGDELSCTWEFGDGSTSTETDPVHTYNEAGEYTVVLTCQDPDGASDSYEKTITVEKEPDPNQAPEVKFTVESKDGLTVVFDNRSSDPDGDDLSYNWEFGDGDTSAESDPTHTFDEPGDYEVILTGEDPDGLSDSYTKTITVDVILSDEYKHKVTFGSDRKIWVSDHKGRSYDDLLTYGEVRPILTDEDPYGEVKIKVKFKLDEDEVDTEHFALEIYFEDDQSDAFRTPIYPDQTGVDGWTTATKMVDASNFAGHAKEIAGVRVVHGDVLDSSKPAGEDDVYFSKHNTDGAIWFCWRVQLSGAQKVLMQGTEYETNITETGSTTNKTN